MVDSSQQLHAEMICALWKRVGQAASQAKVVLLDHQSSGRVDGNPLAGGETEHAQPRGVRNVLTGC